MCKSKMKRKWKANQIAKWNILKWQTLIVSIHALINSMNVSFLVRDINEYNCDYSMRWNVFYICIAKIYGCIKASFKYSLFILPYFRWHTHTNASSEIQTSLRSMIYFYQDKKHKQNETTRPEITEQRYHVSMAINAYLNQWISVWFSINILQLHFIILI